MNFRPSNGNLIFRRGIFRKFRKVFLEDNVLHRMIREDPQFHMYKEALNWVINTKHPVFLKRFNSILYEKRHQMTLRSKT